MKLYIPEIGDKIRLVAPWTFDLYNESRNETLMEFIGDKRATTWGGEKYGTVTHTIPAGEVLKIDRIYIRRGAADYSSITFLWVDRRTQRKEEPRLMTSLMGPTPKSSHYMVKIPAKPVRFWAKLSDVNSIEFEAA